MGTTQQNGSPIYNLKRNYGYDVDRNSGKYKTVWEKFRDFINDCSVQFLSGSTAAVAAAIIVYVLKSYVTQGITPICKMSVILLP